MAQESARPAGQHRSHPALRLAHLSTAHYENPAMKGAEPAGAEAVVDGLVGEAKLAKLRSSDHAVLPSR
jgi:hypothetical protein